MGGNHLATLPQLTVAEDMSDLAERVRDIERRLTRIEAELAALR
jgi:tetrahydromethanopterin S-methyltransferase subunit G